MKVLIIIPAYNETQTLEKVIEHLKEICPQYDYVIVNDGSTDKTEELCRKKEFSNLKGLLYFTDGFGMYPRRMPPFQTAFVFMDEEQSQTDVPPWAMKIVLRSEMLSHS